MTHYKLLSVLLDYPTVALLESLDEIEKRLADKPGLSADNTKRLSNFIAYLRSIELLDLEGEYVQTFDLNPDHSLHLTHHLCGDDRNRGPALIELTELYRQHGLELPEHELPDYLPLVLEFLHTLPEGEAQAFLNQAGRVLVVLAANLEKAGSAWHAPLRILADLSGCTETPDEIRPSKEACQSACGALID
ncbi:MAG: nitrate reductase molybdenum cofactor assembly chaperone [Rhodospirillales bacterium]|nr:nitrate reductase molybdenum cofactor assembly chaperone [Rhodospirillales bacterium]